MNDQSKTIAIVSYLTLIGWVIALIMRNSEKPQSALSRFHLRQSLGVHLLSFILSLLQYSLFMMHLSFIGRLLALGVFILWVLGLIRAIQGEFKPLPLVGRWFDETFTFIH